MSDSRKVILRYLITLVVAVAMLLAVLRINDYWSQTDLSFKLLILADGFTVPGVILVMVATLLALGSKGAFDGLSYALRHGLMMLVPFGGKNYKHQTYYDYKKSKGERTPRGYSCMFFVGAAFVLIAIALVWIGSSV